MPGVAPAGITTAFHAKQAVQSPGSVFSAKVGEQVLPSSKAKEKTTLALQH